MEGETQHYRLRWNNHLHNIATTINELLENEIFTDVTLAVESGWNIKCHKMVLAACSTYFQNLFNDLSCAHPIVVLQNVKEEEIKAILSYMYNGEVSVAQDQLPSLIKVAENLKIKGLVQESMKEELDKCMSPLPSSNKGHSKMRSAHSTEQLSPLHSTTGSSSSISHPYNLYAKSPVDRDHGRFPMPMWPLSGMPFPQTTFPNHHHPSNPVQQALLMASSSSSTPYDAAYDNSPLRRKKHSSMMATRDTPILRNVLDQGHEAQTSSSSHSHHHHDQPHHYRSSTSNGSANDYDNHRRSSLDRSRDQRDMSPPYKDSMDDNDKQASPQSCTGSDSKPTQNKPEWKKYKQYSQDDIQQAIKAVKGGMSALQASRMYNVPSRTLYDKVKKLGVTPTRPFKRNNGCRSASFPYGVGANVNGSIYNNGGAASESEGEANMSSSVREVASPTANDNVNYSNYEEDTAMDCCKSPPSNEHVVGPEDSGEDQVEDLSLARKPSGGDHVPVIVPNASVIKDEKLEPDSGTAVLSKEDVNE